MSNCQELADILTREVDRPGVSAVCADLTHVTFIGSSGIEAPMIAYRHAQDTRRRFAVTGTRGHVHSVLTISGVLAALT